MSNRIVSRQECQVNESDYVCYLVFDWPDRENPMAPTDPQAVVCEGCAVGDCDRSARQVRECMERIAADDAHASGEAK